MSAKLNGELVPEGGGDNIPLIREILTVGRRETCDICLHLPNVSGLHCEFSFQDGFWWVKDMNSTNGIKVNGVRVPKKLLNPGERITIGKKTFTIEYQPPAGAKPVTEDGGDVQEDILSQSLLERAGLAKPSPSDARPSGKDRDTHQQRYVLEGEDEEEEM